MDTPIGRPSTPVSPRITAITPFTPLDAVPTTEEPQTPSTPTSAFAAHFALPHARLAQHDREATPTTYDLEDHYQPPTFPRLPPELIALIVHHLYYSILPTPTLHPSPDPYLHLVPSLSPYVPPTFLPTPSEQARANFANLSLVDTNWGDEGRKALWRNVGIGMPRAFESILRTIEEYKNGRRQRRLNRRLASQGFDYEEEHQGDSEETSAWTELEGMELGGEPELESRGTSRTAEYDDLGTDGQWAQLGKGPGGSDITAGGHDTPRQTSLTRVPDVLDPAHSPLLLTRTLSFSRFRTAGLRRSVRQGSHERFVTPHRLLTLLRGTRVGQEVLEYPGSKADEEESVSSSVFDEEEEDDAGGLKILKGKLESVGFTEFMDSAISKNVIDELLFRGGYLAEYEEKEMPVHIDLSDSEMVAASFSPLPPTPSRFTSVEREGRGYHSSSSTGFLARHLQSSHSRSPSSQRYSNLGPSVREESGDSTDDSLTDNEENAFRRGERSRNRRGKVEFAPPISNDRRGSGSTFATSHYSEEFDREESEERGRERSGRMERASGRGRPIVRRNRSLAPTSSVSLRSSSVPAVQHHRSMSVGDSERSLSVPASQRRFRGTKKIVRILEGSKEVRPLRALDLCGCVSHSFVTALEEVVTKYRLGPPGLLPSAAAPTAESNYDSMDDDSGTEGGYAMSDSMSSRWSSASSIIPGDEFAGRRKLKRIYFPHLRRLGISFSLLPSPLLTSLVLSFPFLTHLDLSSTLASPILIKHLALAGQSGPGGRSMRLAALNLARCRSMTGEAIVGLLCGDCPPFTSMSGHGEDAEDESWGSGEVVMDLIDLSLFGDATYPCPLTLPEVRLVLTISPAFTSGRLRTLDLSSIPLSDSFLEDHFPILPQLMELGLAGCRGISYKGVAYLLVDKAPGVEILVLSGSCRPTGAPAAPGRRATDSAKLSVMELHVALLGRVASVNPSSSNPTEAGWDLVRRKTNLRVVELDDKTLEGVQGGAGDWRVIWGKGRRGWYVDIATTSIANPDPYPQRPRKLIHLPKTNPRRQALQRLVSLSGVVSGEVGWHARKMEVLRGDGMMGREDGLFAFHSYQT